MALSTSYAAPIGATFATAYARITDLSLRYSAGAGEIVVAVHATEQARRDGAQPLATHAHQVPLADLVAAQQPGDTDPRQTAYRYLKALPEWAGAIDHLDVWGD